MAVDILFEAEALTKTYRTRGGSGFLASLFGKKKFVHAVDEVSFGIRKGEILGLAGQSGSGKSTLGDLLLNLERPTSGEIRFQGDDISKYTKSEMKKFRQECQMVFQDPYESLNPRITVGRLVLEPLVIHDIGDREERTERTLQALEDAGLHPPETYLNKLPRELSGGERQRVSIARALVLNPSFLVADEPVSMLDVSVRSGILNLFKELKERRDLTMLYISHDLTTINYLSDRTMIMYLGNIVEIGPTEEVIHHPSHPYTETLIKAVPTTDLQRKAESADLAEYQLDPIDLPTGCRFEPNCSYATKECREGEPPITQFTRGERYAACYHPIGGSD